MYRVRGHIPGGSSAHPYSNIVRSFPEIALQHLIEHQLARCSPEEQALLEAASVAGVEFSAAAVAAAVHQEVVDVEARCAVLARRQALDQGGLGGADQ